MVAFVNPSSNNLPAKCKDCHKLNTAECPGHKVDELMDQAKDRAEHFIAWAAIDMKLAVAILKPWAKHLVNACMDADSDVDTKADVLNIILVSAITAAYDMGKELAQRSN